MHKILRKTFIVFLSAILLFSMPVKSLAEDSLDKWIVDYSYGGNVLRTFLENDYIMNQGSVLKDAYGNYLVCGIISYPSGAGEGVFHLLQIDKDRTTILRDLVISDATPKVILSYDRKHAYVEYINAKPAETGIVCIDLENGKELWRKKFPKDKIMLPHYDFRFYDTSWPLPIVTPNGIIVTLFEYHNPALAGSMFCLKVQYALLNLDGITYYDYIAPIFFTDKALCLLGYNSKNNTVYGILASFRYRIEPGVVWIQDYIKDLRIEERSIADFSIVNTFDLSIDFADDEDIQQLQNEWDFFCLRFEKFPGYGSMDADFSKINKMPVISCAYFRNDLWISDLVDEGNAAIIVPAFLYFDGESFSIRKAGEKKIFIREPEEGHTYVEDSMGNGFLISKMRFESPALYELSSYDDGNFGIFMESGYFYNTTQRIIVFNQDGIVWEDETNINTSLVPYERDICKTNQTFLQYSAPFVYKNMLIYIKDYKIVARDIASGKIVNEISFDFDPPPPEYTQCGECTYAKTVFAVKSLGVCDGYFWYMFYQISHDGCKRYLATNIKIYSIKVKGKEYSITPAKLTEGGSISPSETVKAEMGTDCSFTISPDQGYKISDVKVDGVSVGAVSSYTFTSVSSDHKIEVSFEKITFNVIASAGMGGTISPSGTSTVDFGGSKSFTITPSYGYKISNVKVDGKSIGPVSLYTFTNITSDHTIEATFEKKSVTIVLQIGSESFTVNGETRTLDSPPVIKNNRTLLPIRAVVEALGGTVGWDATERKVTITLSSTTIELWIGKSTAKVNGINTPIDATNPKVVPEIINGRTMLPLRFVTENLGCTVDWDGTTQTITITYQP